MSHLIDAFKGEALGYRALELRYKKIRDQFSFKNRLTVDSLQFRDLRHVYAQTLRDSGVSLGDLQSFLGHSSVTITESRYAPQGGFDGIMKVEKLGKIIDFDKLRKTV